jgi:hypothetical protein
LPKELVPDYDDVEPEPEPKHAACRTEDIIHDDESENSDGDGIVYTNEAKVRLQIVYQINHSAYLFRMEVEENVIQKAKRGRGRPRKQPKPNVPQADRDDNHHLSVQTRGMQSSLTRSSTNTGNPSSLDMMELPKDSDAKTAKLAAGPHRKRKLIMSEDEGEEIGRFTTSDAPVTPQSETKKRRVCDESEEEGDDDVEKQPRRRDIGAALERSRVRDIESDDGGIFTDDEGILHLPRSQTSGGSGRKNIPPKSAPTQAKPIKRDTCECIDDGSSYGDNDGEDEDDGDYEDSPRAIRYPKQKAKEKPTIKKSLAKSKAGVGRAPIVSRKADEESSVEPEDSGAELEGMKGASDLWRAAHEIQLGRRYERKGRARKNVQ